jgi:hypothetical protein
MAKAKPKTKTKTNHKSKKTPKYIEAILSNLRAGLTIKAACTQAGVHPRTVDNWRKDDADFNDEFDAAIDFGEAALYNDIRISDDWRAKAWLLERRHPERWSIKRDMSVNISKENDGSTLVASMLAQGVEAITGEPMTQSIELEDEE